MVSELDDSYRLASRLTRQSARNFYFSFLTLPRALRRDMCALYAFMRQTDDLCDDETLPVEVRTRLLDEWNYELRSALDSKRAGIASAAAASLRHAGAAILPALVDVVRRHA